MQSRNISCRERVLICLFAILLAMFTNAASAQETSKTAASSPLQPPAATAPSAERSGPAGLGASSLPPGLDPKTMRPVYESIQEDWSSLDIGTSRLEPEPPLVAGNEEQETYTRTLVQVKWRPGDPIDLWVLLPKNVKKPPVVLYLYDTSWDTNRFRDPGWGARATSGGVAAVGFVSALSGHRFHDRPMTQWFVSELQESVGSTVHDVKFILDYLSQRGDVDMDRVGMFGQGSGGAIAILSAAADSRIKAVDALDPWGDWPDFLAKSPLVLAAENHEQYVTPDFLKRVAPLDPVKWLPDLKATLRIQQVHRETTVPMECKDRIKAAAPNRAEVVRFEALADLGMREGQGRLFEWIKSKVAQPQQRAAEVSVADKDGVKPPQAAASSPR